MKKNSPRKNLIFISHIHEDKSYALLIKRILEQHFRGAFEIFVSSDSESITLGEDWKEKTFNRLKDSNIVLVLCSPNSISRPWVNFEAGGAFFKDILTIPLCTRGLEVNQLQQPLSTLQAIKLYTHDDFELLSRTIETQFALKPYPIDCTLTDEYCSLLQTTKDFDSYIDEYETVESILRTSLVALKVAMLAGYSQKITMGTDFECTFALENSKYLFEQSLDLDSPLDIIGEKRYQKIKYELSCFAKCCKIALHISNDKTLKYIFSSVRTFEMSIERACNMLDSASVLIKKSPDLVSKIDCSDRESKSNDIQRKLICDSLQMFTSACMVVASSIEIYEIHMHKMLSKK